MLKRLGCSVTIANHGEHALQILQTSNQEFSIILMDLEMPNLGTTSKWILFVHKNEKWNLYVK
jgi:CheY-like chemotaxis protein